MNWRAVLTAVLLVSAVAMGWSLWREHAAPDDAGAASGRIDYALHDFEMVSLDETGREAFTLRAPQLTRSLDDRTLAIQTPLFSIPPAAGSASAPWQVRAREGWVSADGDELRLRGRVNADSVDAQGRPLNMATEQLNVFPRTRRATSRVAVTLTQPGLILNGHGLDARLDAKRLHLSDVKARYE